MSVLEAGVASGNVLRFLNSEVVVIDANVVFKPGMKTLLRDFSDER